MHSSTNRDVRKKAQGGVGRSKKSSYPLQLRTRLSRLAMEKKSHKKKEVAIIPPRETGMRVRCDKRRQKAKHAVSGARRVHTVTGEGEQQGKRNGKDWAEEVKSEKRHPNRTGRGRAGATNGEKHNARDLKKSLERKLYIKMMLEGYFKGGNKKG